MRTPYEQSPYDYASRYGTKASLFEAEDILNDR